MLHRRQNLGLGRVEWQDDLYMTIGDSVDGSGSGLLNTIYRDLPGRTKGYNNEGLDHVTPSKTGNKMSSFLRSRNKVI
jgi:hypothetical protein